MKLFDTVVPTGGTPIGRVLDQCITKYMSSWMRNFAPQEDIKEWNEFLDRRAGIRASYTNYQHKAKASKTTLEQEEDDSSVPKPVNYLVITDGEPSKCA